MRFHLHWYREVRNTGVHSYRVCCCGKRKIVQLTGRAHQPIDRGWLETGEWTGAPTLPPRRSRA